MIQQTHPEQAHENEMVYATGSGISRFFITVLHRCFGAISKVGANVALGFQIFVDNAEQHGLPRN
jgi:hypothetical protein